MALGTLPAALDLALKQYAKLGPRPVRLPDPKAALPDGIAGICDDVDPGTLLRGYGRGMYLRDALGTPVWCAPGQRAVLFLDDFRLDARLSAKLAKSRYRVSVDADFGQVVRLCAAGRPRQPARDWLSEPVRAAFGAAHEAGMAHSLEVWNDEDELIGGVFGLALGRMFFTEAQFSAQPQAGRIGFAVLNGLLKQRGFLANDAKQPSGTLHRQGFSVLSRAGFERFLEKAVLSPTPLGSWRLPDAPKRAAVALWGRNFAGAA